MVRGRATVRDLGKQSGYRIKRGGDTGRSWAEGTQRDGEGKKGLCSPPLWRVLVSGELRKLWRKKMGAVHGTNPNSPTTGTRVHVPGTCQMCCSHGQAQLPTYSPTDLRCTSNPFEGPGLTSPQQQCQQRGQRQQQQRCRGGCTEWHGGESGLSAGQTASVSAL